ncbi:MAG: peptidylprolyl isomerase [Limnochordia bacterium]|nr:peptidylprolyl isomerase [Limnochordia bacterium]
MFHKMRAKMKAVVIIVIVAMAGGGLWAAASYFFGDRQQVPAEAAAVVATVNGQAISAWDLYQVFMNQLQQVEAQQGTLPGRAYEAVRYQALDLLVGSLVLNQEIAKRNFTASKAEVDAELQRIIDMFPSEEEYKAQLQYSGMTEDVLRSQLGEELKYDKLTKEIIGDLPVSEDEIRQAFEEVRTSHILIRPDGQSEEDWGEAEKQAREIFSQVTVDNFAELAETLSADGSAVQGGDIGFVPRGATVAEYEAVAFSLAVGEISEPVRSTYGYHIITVTERKEAEGEEFEAARGGIEDRIRNEKGESDLHAWFEEARGLAEVVIMDYQMKGYEHMQAGEYEDAVHYYKLAIEQAPADGYLHASLGDVYYEMDQIDEALIEYKLATEAVNDYALLAGLGDIYRESERFEEAAEAYLKASELVPNDIWTQLALYQYLTDMERTDDALIVEGRIEAFQEMQAEYLRQQQEEQAAAEGTNEDVNEEAVEEEIEPAEELDGDSDPEN